VKNATTAGVRDKKGLATDGPFAETKDNEEGDCLIEAKNLDAALRVATRVPSLR
jgi:hypothetical protein